MRIKKETKTYLRGSSSSQNFSYDIDFEYYANSSCIDIGSKLVNKTEKIIRLCMNLNLVSKPRTEWHDYYRYTKRGNYEI